MTFPCPNQNFQTQNTNINCVNIRFCGSYINLLNQLPIYITILIVTPCLRPWIREFIHAQNCNTMLKTTAIPFIWTKSLYKHSVIWSHHIKTNQLFNWFYWWLNWKLPWNEFEKVETVVSKQEKISETPRMWSSLVAVLLCDSDLNWQ